MCKHFAHGDVDLKEWDLIVADATAHLAECIENPQDDVLSCTMTGRDFKDVDDRQVTLADE